MSGKKEVAKGLFLIETKFGWTLAGKLENRLHVALMLAHQLNH